MPWAQPIRCSMLHFRAVGNLAIISKGLWQIFVQTSSYQCAVRSLLTWQTRGGSLMSPCDGKSVENAVRMRGLCWVEDLAQWLAQWTSMLVLLSQRVPT